MSKTLGSVLTAFLLALAPTICPASSEEAVPAAARSAPPRPGEDHAQASEGRSLFNQTCAHCHGPDAAAGQPERNLRHLRVRYGSDMHDVFKATVMNGRLEKGMPVWGEVLDDKTIEAIYSFLETVQEDAE